MENQLKGWVTPAIVGVISFAAGAVTGYLVKKYQDSIIAVVNEDMVLEEKDSQFSQLMFAFEERDRKYDVTLQQAMKVITSLQDVKNEFVDAVIHTGLNPESEVIFAVETEDGLSDWNEETDDDWDYEEELKHRGPEDPYIIHRDEFFADEEGYDNHTSLTYYKGDDILCDELDTPIYNSEKITGPLVFGHGSQDPSIVYIRNPHLKAEYEILLEYGTFAEEILQQKVTKSKEAEEFKHSLMKFREE